MLGTSNLPKILILATATCAYPAADAAGQAHLHYAPNTYILRVPSPVVFPEEFYYRCFEKGIGGILVMSYGQPTGRFPKGVESGSAKKLNMRAPWRRYHKRAPSAQTQGATSENPPY